MIVKYSKHPHRCGDWKPHIHLKTLDSSVLEPCRITTPRVEDNSTQSCNSRFSNRDGDKEAKLTDYSFKWASLRRHTHGPLAKRMMHVAHLSGNTSGASKSSSDWLNYTGFPEDVCVAFFNIPPEKKNSVVPDPFTKEESRRVYNCNGERLSGSTTRWIFKSMWNI